MAGDKDKSTDLVSDGMEKFEKEELQKYTVSLQPRTCSSACFFGLSGFCFALLLVIVSECQLPKKVLTERTVFVNIVSVSLLLMYLVCSVGASFTAAPTARAPMLLVMFACACIIGLDMEREPYPTLMMNHLLLCRLRNNPDLQDKAVHITPLDTIFLQ